MEREYREQSHELPPIHESPVTSKTAHTRIRGRGFELGGPPGDETLPGVRAASNGLDPHGPCDSCHEYAVATRALTGRRAGRSPRPGRAPAVAAIPCW